MRALGEQLNEKRTNGVCILLCAGTVVQSLAAVAVALVRRRLLNSAMGGGAVLRWGALLGLLAVGGPILSGVLSRLSGAAEDAASARLRKHTLERLRTRDLEKLKGYHSGQLYSRVTGDIGTVCLWKTSVLPGMVSQAVRLAAAAAALFWIDPVLAVWGLGCAVVVAFASVFYRRLLRPRHKAAREAQEQLTVTLQEELGHGEFIRALRAETQMDRRLDRSQERWRKSRKALRDVSILGGAGFSAMTQVVFVAVMVWGGVSIRAGRLTYGDLTALLQLAAMFQGPVSGLGGLQSRLAELSAARERLSELWELPEEGEGRPLPPGAKVRAIVFEQVTFRYEGEEQAVLENFSVRLPADRWMGLRGISGSGKSTLGRILEEVYDCNMFHVDDFFLQPEQRTPERLAEVGGNLDYERFKDEILDHLADSEGFSYQVYNCGKQALDGWVKVPYKKLNIIEGAYSHHPYFGDPYDLKFFCKISGEEQVSRIMKRNGPEMLERFKQVWIPMENRYFAAFGIEEKSIVI